MNKIIWDESFQVGVEKLDQQHKELVAMINYLIDLDQNPSQSDVVLEMINRMTNYAEKHFQDEEAYMLDYHFPHYATHHKEHMAFIRKTAEFITDTISMEENVSNEMLLFLKKWLVSHILYSDMQYKEFFQKKGLF